MNRTVQITVLLLLAAGVALGAEAKSVATLLQEGIYAEETEGNLDKAIGIYQEAAKSAAVTEKAAAEAIFRTGMCYLKKGDKTAAQKQFQLVLSKYASQTAIAAQARKQLAGSLRREVVLKDSFENGTDAPDGWQQGPAVEGVEYIWDRGGNIRGTSSLCLKKTANKFFPIAQWTRQLEYDGKASAIEVKTQVKAEKVFKATMDVLFLDQDGKWIRHDWVSYIGNKDKTDTPVTHDWKTYEGKAHIPANTKKIVIGLQMYGPGTVWFDQLDAEAVYPDSAEANSGQAVAPAKPLEIGAAPWTDGEVCKLVLKTKSDMTIGATYYMPHLVKEGGKDIWQLDSFLFVTVQESRQFTQVQADVTTMAPIAGRTMNQMGDFIAAYEKDKVTLSSTIKGKTTTRDIAVSGPVFDNEEVIMLMRRLPLAEGYGTTIPIFTVQGGQAIECRIEVLGTEEVTVPFGTSRCWMVKLAVYSGQIKALEHTLWFSADEKKLLMKYDAGTVVMELAEVSKVQPQTVISDSKSGISIILPAGWLACTDGATNERRLSWPIANDELETWCIFVAQESSGSADLNAAVDGDIEVLKGFFKDYVTRPDSRKSLSLDGMPAMTYTADYTDDGKPMVEYRTYIMAKGRICWFVFRIESDKFDANKATYDGIVSSFTLAGK